MWCVATLDQEYIARMEDVLKIYENPLSESQPVVCVDEKPVVLHEDTRPSILMRPGQVSRRDYEYKRCHQGDAHALVAGIRRLPLGDSRALPRRRHHPSGHGQPEHPLPQSAGRPIWRRSGRMPPCYGTPYLRYLPL